MDIPWAIPRSKELLSNLFLQERSLDKSCKKVGGIRKRSEMNGQKKMQTNKNPHGDIFAAGRKALLCLLELNFICMQFRTIWVLFV